MARQNNDGDGDLEALIARTKKERLQVDRTREKFKNLEAAIESAKEAQEKAKSLESAASTRKPAEAAAEDKSELESEPEPPESKSNSDASPAS